MTMCECEPRVGGALRLAWKNEEADPVMTLQGVFTETTMRITQAYDSKDARDGAIASGMDEGMEAGYKQLDAVLAQLA